MWFRNLGRGGHVYAILAARYQIITRWVVDGRVVIEELIQAQRRVSFDNGPAYVSCFDLVELVALGVVVFRADGSVGSFADAIRASRVHVVAAWAGDGRVQVEELRGCESVGRRNGLAGSGGNEVGLRTA
jgi:hypothetical protein